MNSLIFAAGKGTRLKPLTDTMPKALVPVSGKPLLQHVLDKLRASGFSNIVVNVHHLAEQIVDYLQGSDVKISDETAELLETGGGLRKALPLFGNSDHVLIHNVDILSNVDLADFYRKSLGNDATLLVSWRETTRYLLFDNNMRLVGWTNRATGEVRSPYPNLRVEDCQMFAFSGIHCVSQTILPHMQSWPTRFPIMDFYLSNCDKLNIRGIAHSDLRLLDVGKLDTLNAAEEFARSIRQQ